MPLNTPLVTVAMVTYNSSKYVKTAIESVLNSSYQNFELIISDDNSSDDSWNVIQTYTDKRIRAYRNENNLKEYANRKKCVDLAKGEYLIYIDGDDYIYPHGLEHFVEGIKLNPDAAMIIARNECDHMIFPVIITPNEAYKYDYLGEGVTSGGFTSTLFKVNHLKEICFNHGYIAGDTFIKKTLAYLYETVLIHTGLTWWRRTPGQASEKLFNSIEGLTQSLSMNKHFLELNKEILTDDEYLQARINTIVYPAFRPIIKNLLKLKFNHVIAIIKSSELKFKDMRLLTSTPKRTYKLANSILPLTTKKYE